MKGTKIGLVLSVLCAIHCVAMPFLVVLTPALAAMPFFEFAHSHVFEGVLLLLSFVLLSADYLSHRKVNPIYVFIVGAFLIAFSHEWVPESVEHPVKWAGSSLTAFAFLLNLRIRKQHDKACAHVH